MADPAELAQVLGQMAHDPAITIIIQTGPQPAIIGDPISEPLAGEAIIGAAGTAELGLFWDTHTHERIDGLAQDFGASDDLLNGNFHVTMHDLIDARDAEAIRIQVDWRFGTFAAPSNGWLRAFGSDSPEGDVVDGRFVIGEVMFINGFQKTTLKIDPRRTPYRYYGLQVAPASVAAGDCGVVSHVLRRRTV